MIKKRNVFISALLALFSPVTAYLYNGKVVFGGILVSVMYLLFYILLISGIAHNFYGFLIVGLYIIAFTLFIIIDNVVTAIKNKNYELKKYNRVSVYIISTILFAFITGSANVLINKYFFQLYSIPAGSMAPAIVEGDSVAVDKSFYRKHKIKRGDLIVFLYPNDRSVTYVKRCVAVSGNNLVIDGKDIIINDKKIVENYPLMYNDEDSIFRDIYDYGIVPDNHIYVLGDNRDNSADSRHFGVVPVKDVIGKPLYIYNSKDRSRIGLELK